MNNRILVAYATKAGSTEEVAGHLAKKLTQHGAQVDLLPVSKVKDISPYRNIVLGSAIRIGKILPEMMEFIKKNQTALQEKEVDVFVLCMTLDKDTPETRKTVSAFIDPVREVIHPRKEGFFAGVVDPSRLGVFERMMMKAINPPVGDFRKWDEIDRWAENLQFQQVEDADLRN